MNKELGKPIALGRTAEIYAWGNDQILKLFYDWREQEDIEYEASLSHAIWNSGLPVPAVGEIIRVNDRTGLIYQRVDGEHMWQAFVRKPWNVFRYARCMAELHAQMHTSPAPQGIPSQRKRLVNKINDAKNLPAGIKSKVLSALEAMPDGDRLCHGDFHPLNIILSAPKETVIDWIDAASGNPLADVARTTIIILGAAESNQIPNVFEKIIVRIFHSVYLNHYFKLHPGGREEYKRWLPIVAAARINEGMIEIESWLIAKAQESLQEGHQSK